MKFIRGVVAGFAVISVVVAVFASIIASAQVASNPPTQSLAVGGDGNPVISCSSGGVCTLQASGLYSLVVQANSGTVGQSITLASSTAGTARAGLRIASSRVISATKPTAAPDCGGATLNLTVAQFLEAGIATCATAQTINFPTWQGASGIVQNLPGPPAVGDLLQFTIAATAANAITPGLGTGGTNGGGTLTVAANTTRIFTCRITAIPAGSETATCY